MIFEMVRVDTDHGGMGCFVINNLGMPQATQGSGYSFQSFFEEKSKKGFTLLSLTQNPQPQKKNMPVIHLSWPPKPDGTDAGIASPVF